MMNKEKLKKILKEEYEASKTMGGSETEMVLISFPNLDILIDKLFEAKQ